MGQKIGLLQWFFSLWQLWGTGQLKNRRLSVCHWCVRWDWVESMSYHPRRWWFSLQRRLWIFHNKAGQCTKWHWYEKLATPRRSTWWLHWFAWLCHRWFGRRGSFWTRGAHATLLLTFWCQQVSGHHCYPRPRQIPKWLLWFSHLVESIWLPEHTAGPSCGWVFALFSAPWYTKWWLSYDSDQQWQDELSLERSQYWQWWWIYSLVQRLIHRVWCPKQRHHSTSPLQFICHPWKQKDLCHPHFHTLGSTFLEHSFPVRPPSYVDSIHPYWPFVPQIHICTIVQIYQWPSYLQSLMSIRVILQNTFGHSHNPCEYLDDCLDVCLATSLDVHQMCSRVCCTSYHLVLVLMVPTTSLPLSCPDCVLLSHPHPFLFTLSSHP